MDAGADAGPATDDAAVDDAGSDAGPVECDAIETDCGGTCVDTSTDPAHCGGCGVTCAPGQICNAGACGASPVYCCAAGAASTRRWTR